MIRPCFVSALPLPLNRTEQNKRFFMRNRIGLLVIAFALLLPACRKKESAGWGGQANLHLVARHHGAVIDSVTFYITFNQTEAPAENDVDYSIKGTTVSPGNTSATISGLKKGDYYILAKGWDPGIAAEVKGGIPYTVRDETDINLIVAVTEVH